MKYKLNIDIEADTWVDLLDRLDDIYRLLDYQSQHNLKAWAHSNKYWSFQLNNTTRRYKQRRGNKIVKA